MNSQPKNNKSRENIWKQAVRKVLHVRKRFLGRELRKKEVVNLKATVAKQVGFDYILLRTDQDDSEERELRKTERKEKLEEENGNLVIRMQILERKMVELMTEVSHLRSENELSSALRTCKRPVEAKNVRHTVGRFEMGAFALDNEIQFVYKDYEQPRTFGKAACNVCYQKRLKYLFEFDNKLYEQWKTLEGNQRYPWRDWIRYEIVWKQYLEDNFDCNGDSERKRTS